MNKYIIEYACIGEFVEHHMQQFYYLEGVVLSLDCSEYSFYCPLINIHSEASSLINRWHTRSQCKHGNSEIQYFGFEIYKLTDSVTRNEIFNSQFNSQTCYSYRPPCF